MTPLRGAVLVTDRHIPPVNLGLFNRFDPERFIPELSPEPAGLQHFFEIFFYFFSLQGFFSAISPVLYRIYDHFPPTSGPVFAP